MQENKDQKQMLRSSETLSIESFNLLEKHYVTDVFLWIWNNVSEKVFYKTFIVNLMLIS